MVKAQLKAKAKAILNTKPIGFIFQQGTPDFNFLIGIFQGHPEYEIKVGSGIENVFISINSVYKNRCFNITRTDGSTTDISYIQSVDGAKSKLSDIKCACRNAVKPIIDAVRSKVFYGVDKCPITGEILTPANTQIDHYNLTFDELFHKWIKSENIELAHACLNDTSKDNEVEIYFTSNYLAQDFINFHNSNTNLRAVSKTANLSTLKRK